MADLLWNQNQDQMLHHVSKVKVEAHFDQLITAGLYIYCFYAKERLQNP